MSKNNYFILTSLEPDTDNSLFWDVGEMTWTPEEGKATRFDSRILCSPLPTGIGLVIECNPDTGIYVNCFAPIELPLVGYPYHPPF
jgi:hypothetical protein